MLNLITNGAPEAEEAQEGQGAQEISLKETNTAAAPDGQKAATENKVIVVNETSENEKLSNEIKNRLEAQLEAEVAQSALSAGEAADELRQEAASPAEPETAGEAVETVETTSSAEDAEVLQPSSEEEEEEPVCHMVNVMEKILADTDLTAQMEQYGVCTCRRCHADVQALVLTKLPAKYVIVGETETSPIIGYYENRYRTQIFTEIMKACLTVKDSPRH